MRFAAALARIWPEGMAGDGRLGLAVSGGADSTALLLLAAEVLPGRITVATVDHGLRAEAAEECAAVARLCAARRIPCDVLLVKVTEGNLQAQARDARYAALAAWAQAQGLAALATAHQADDQAETVLMRLARGSGVAGLAGIRERGQVPGTELALLRPLLTFSRAECEALCRAAGQAFVDDPSNHDDHYDRVRLRKLLQAMPLADPQAIVASAAHCADADAALAWATEREWREQVRCEPGRVRYRPQAPRAIAIRIVERAVDQLGGSLRGSQAADMADALARGKQGNAGGVLARSEGGEWLFAPEPPRRL
jgi:tRNA(Ile)-lysidine synthase